MAGLIDKLLGPNLDAWVSATVRPLILTTYSASFCRLTRLLNYDPCKSLCEYIPSKVTASYYPGFGISRSSTVDACSIIAREGQCSLASSNVLRKSVSKDYLCKH